MFEIIHGLLCRLLLGGERGYSQMWLKPSLVERLNASVTLEVRKSSRLCIDTETRVMARAAL
jgi:hypothetical protein